MDGFFFMIARSKLHIQGYAQQVGDQPDFPVNKAELVEFLDPLLASTHEDYSSPKSVNGHQY